MLSYYFRLAIISFKRNIALTILMVLTIAIGIGSSMTSLSVVRLLKGDPIPDKSTKLYFVQLDYRPIEASTGDTNPPLVMPYRDAAALMAGAPATNQAMMDAGIVSVVPSNEKDGAFVADSWYTTAAFFSMFDVKFRFGAPWSATNDEAREHVVVISSKLNNKLFQGQNSVGKMLTLTTGQFRIVGVIGDWRPEPKFYSIATSSRFAAPEDVFVPLSAAIDQNLQLNGATRCFGADFNLEKKTDSGCGWLFLWAQLDSTSAVQKYRSYIDNYSSQQHDFGRFGHASNTQLRDVPTLLSDIGVVPRDVVLQTFASFGFLIVCIVNCIGLMLAKFMSRKKDATIRRSLGARTKDIFLQYLVEAGLIGVVGGLVGLGLTELGILWVRGRSQDYASLVHLNAAIVVVALCSALLGALIAGILPAYRICSTPPALNLKGA